MQTDDLVVRVQVQDGVWETLGSDRVAGVVPESLQAVSNGWCSDTASWLMRRNPGQVWPDLFADTPVEIEIAGEVDWTGYIKETPSHDGDDPQVNVEALGWQHHLDDDSYARGYVFTRLGDWRDARTFPTTDLTKLMSAPTVSSDNGTIALSWAAGQLIKANAYAAVVLDLGPFANAASISFDYASSNNSAVMSLYARVITDPANIVTTADTVGPILNNAGAGTTARNTAPTPARYVALLISNNSGIDQTPAADVWFKLTGIRVFTNDAWRNVDASILKASDVIKDALTQAAPLLSTDVSRIATTAFSFPDLHFETAPRSVREVIDGVNAPHDYLTYVDIDKRMVFQPQPSAAIFEVGAWGGAEFDDAAMNSSEDVVDKVSVTGTGPDGAPMIVTRYSAQQASAQSIRGQVAASWAAGGSLTPTDNFGALTFPAPIGAPIVIVAQPRVGSGGYPKFSAGAQPITILVGNTNPAFSGNGDTASFTFDGNTATTQVFVWTPKAAHTDSLEVKVTLANNTFAGGILIDVYRGATILDRRGKTRTKALPIDAALNTTVGQAIGDVYLAAHRIQPLKGALAVTLGGMRRVLTGETVHPAHLLREPGQLIRLGHRIDPDTGGVTRDGQIAQVTYDHGKREAKVDLDSTRKDFEALLARYGALAPAT